jgi:hypothetical protein
MSDLSPQCAQELASTGMHHSGDRDLGASVAAQMHEVCERLPVPVAHAALARYGFVEA